MLLTQPPLLTSVTGQSLLFEIVPTKAEIIRFINALGSSQPVFYLLVINFPAYVLKMGVKNPLALQDSKHYSLVKLLFPTNQSMDHEHSVNALFKSLGAPSTDATVVATRQVVNEHHGSTANANLGSMEGD